ncbi:CRISPR-associated endonuclease Cas2 [Limisphaera sp. VF-2]|jgi:CRISPR-associated protein Cas2|uniref:CRISPR-associated endonuclease Cas2 n=1 Tax=Limisphaera sp. VF-2 TaxID=3400418 RepID=UPI003C21F18A
MMSFSAYKGMWLMAFFDLPVDTPDRRRQYARFRKALVQDGFMMLQYSVYARYCPNEDFCRIHARKVQEAVPPDGEVRLLRVTERQFGGMEVYWGKKRVPAEEKPVQLELF